MGKDAVVVNEEIYQKIKKEMRKKNDVFTIEEYEVLTKRRGEIQAKNL